MHVNMMYLENYFPARVDLYKINHLNNLNAIMRDSTIKKPQIHLYTRFLI